MRDLPFFVPKAGFAGIAYAPLPARLSEMEEYKGLSETELQEIAYDETIAEMSETILTDTDAANRLSQQIYKQDRTLWQKIKDFFTGLVEKLRSAYKDSDPDSDIGRLLKRAVQDNTEIAQAWAEAVSEAGENYQLQDGQKNNAREGVRFSLRGKTQQELTANFQAEVDSVLNMQDTTAKQLVVGYTPSLYESLGMPSLPLTIGSGHVYSAAKTETEAKQDGNYKKGVHYHGLGDTAIKNIYNAVQDPVMVIAAKDVSKNASPMRSTHSVVAIVDIGTAGKSLLIPVEITAERTLNGEKTDVNTISSVYERNTENLVKEAIALEVSGDTGIYYAKKEALTLPSAGVRFPVRIQQSIASDGIVHRLSEKVNMKVSEATQSQQFKRWFGDWQNDPANASKVVNKDGTPKVMYHGTGAEFTVFDRSKGKKKIHLNVFGDGNYFTALESGATRYGQNVVAAYLDIKNPYVKSSEYNTVADQIANDFGLDRTTYTGKDVSAILKARGYDGVFMLDGNGEVAIANAFDSNQIKSATDNVGTFDKSNPDIRYSARNQQDSEYMALAKEPEENREKLGQIVEERAREAGYDSPVLYHGTQSFGFTAFDLSKMDDGRSIFLTSSPEIASSYSGTGGVRNISDARNMDVSKLSPNEVAQMLNQFPTDDGFDTSYSYVSSKDEIAKRVNSGFAELNKLIISLKGQYGKDSNEAVKLQKLQTSIYLGNEDGIATQLWSLLKLTDVFKGHEAFVSELEQDVRLLKKVKNTTGGFYVEKSLDGYSIEAVTDLMARETLRENLRRGNYSMYTKLGNSLTVDGNGAYWNQLPTGWAKQLEVKVGSTYVAEVDGEFCLFRKSDDEFVDGGAIDANEKTRNLPEAYLHDLLVNKANNVLYINTQQSRNTRSVAKWAKTSGYDSVVFRNIKDSGGQNSRVSADTQADIYVIFDPNNVKSADAVTYDDSGNVIPLSQRFNADNADIRFSDRNSQSRQVERLEKKNAELKAEAEYLKQVVKVQKSGNKAHILDRSSVNAIGKGLMESVNAKGSEFGKLLNDFYRALGTEDMNYEAMQDRAGELAEWLLEHR